MLLKRLWDRIKGKRVPRERDYVCGMCRKPVAMRELKRLWDWRGPHCPHCGWGGSDMYCDYAEHVAEEGRRTGPGEVLRW